MKLVRWGNGVKHEYRFIPLAVVREKTTNASPGSIFYYLTAYRAHDRYSVEGEYSGQLPGRLNSR